jgi:hypothetical protein
LANNPLHFRQVQEEKQEQVHECKPLLEALQVDAFGYNLRFHGPGLGQVRWVELFRARGRLFPLEV